MAEYTVNQMTYNGDTFQFKDNVSGYTTATGTLTDIQVNGTSVVSNGIANITTVSIINLLYPVGSYYETSDSTFSPSSAGWPGTWSLETAGQVHISGSASGTYKINGALSNASDGGATTVSYTPQGTVGGKALDNVSYWPAHDHSGTYSSGTATPACYVRRWGSTSSNTYQLAINSGNITISQQTGSTSTRPRATMATTTDGYWRQTINQTHTHSSTGKATPNAHTHGTSGAVTGTATNLSTMQPYININRWHRTA